MTAIGVALMGAGVWIILSVPDLSGGTLFGAALFLLGLWVLQRIEPRPRRPRDSTDAAVDTIAAGMVDQ